MSVLEVENIRKAYGKAPVLKGISFSLEKGEVLSVIGSSGSGKTTLLRCLNFLETPEAGCIRVNGETLLDAADPATMGQKAIREKRLHFGLVFQQFNLFPQYTVQENVTLAKKLLARERLKKSGSFEGRTDLRQIFSAIDREAEALLSQVGMSAKAGSYPCQLSGGQQQRAAIARAMVQKARVLLADEPIASLDPESSRKVMELLAEVNQQDGITVVVTLHQVDFAIRYCRRTVALKEGCIVYDGPSDRLTPAFLREIYGASSEELFARATGGDEEPALEPRLSLRQACNAA